MFVNFAIAAAALAYAYVIYCILGSNAHHKGWLSAIGNEPMSTLFVPMIFIPRFLKGYAASARHQGHEKAFYNWMATHPEPNGMRKGEMPLPATIIVPAKFTYCSKSAKAYIEGYNSFFKQQEEQKRKEIEADLLSRHLARR
jgi:hypothetical protein